MTNAKRITAVLGVSVVLLAACAGTDHAIDAGDDGDAGADSGTGDYWLDGTCNGPDSPSSSTCDDVTYEGCCDATGRVLYCDGALFCIDCAALDPVCGWSSNGYYDCATEGGADPTGEHSIACD